MVTYDVYMYINPLQYSSYDAMIIRMKHVNIIFRYVYSFVVVKSSGINRHFHAL